MEIVHYAVIGGSGLYNMPDLTEITALDLETPFGKPSDTITIGSLEGVRVAFLPRHGRGHIYTPSEVPYRANIFALKLLGVTHVISVSACGSLKEELAPGHIVVPDQLYDNTRLDRGRTFFGNGLVAHVSVAEPFCPDLSRIIAKATREAGGTVHEGGTFVTVEGPRFSTRAESEVFRRMGFAIIGMTTSPEAFLAREAEMCYAVMAHVTDYDVWHHSAEAVSAELVFKQFNANIGLAQRAIRNAIAMLAREAPPCTYQDALSSALATARERVTPETLSRLAPLVSKYFSTASR